jgi:glucose/arabinose dehydrogenase
MAVLAAATLLVGGCADFSASESAPFTGLPTGQPKAPKRPTIPSSRIPKPKAPCVDQDPAVIATCLTDPTDVLPTSDLTHTYVAQRGGAVVYTTTDQPNQQVLQVPVDASGDGGLVSLVPAPGYYQNQLMFALITTPTDNRVVRITDHDVPKVILAGIPKGSTGNVGSLLFAGKDLVVATGDAGNPAAANDPNSLAGKVFVLASPDTITPARPRLLASGLGTRVSLCRSARGGPLFIADHGETEDSLRAVSVSGGPVQTVWTWPDRPGLAGCAVADSLVAVSSREAGKVEGLTIPGGGTTADGDPKLMVDRARYGTVARLAPGPNGVIEGVTVNKAMGTAGPNDDRVVLIPFGAAGGQDKD